jgi:hypothetical protein
MRKPSVPRIAIHIFYLSLLSPLAAHLWAQGTYTATSCNQNAVNTLINGPTHVAVDGDVINIPAGTCTWTSPLAVTAGISIVGAGVSSTIIQHGFARGTLISITLASASQTFRMSGMALNAGSVLGGQPTLFNIAGTCNTTTCSHIRLDHVNSSGWANGTTFSGFLLYTNNVFGVIDHWTVAFTSGGEFMSVGHSALFGVGDNGDNSWAQPDFHGTDKFLYIEDSSFSTTASIGMAITDTDNAGGGRFVGRFNTMNNANYQTHGTESSGRKRGGRVYEVYNNSLTLDAGIFASFMGWRSGTGFVFNNSKAGAGHINEEVNLSNFREGAAFWPWGNCNGQGPYDQNDGVVYASGTFTAVDNTNKIWTDSTKSWTANQWLGYSVVDITLSESGVGGGGHPVSYHPGGSVTSNTSNTITSTVYNAWAGNTTELPFQVGDNYQILRAIACADAPGRGGAGATLQSDVNNPIPTGWVNQPLDPVYEWGSTANVPPGVSWVSLNQTTVRLVENRDYYQQVSPFTGATGTGTGTLANRPSNCTNGVAYWATDQGNWNESGSGGQGQLYTCTSTNTWTLSYTPYTYPHPLTGGGITTPLAPPRPTAPSSLQTIVH